MEPLVYAAVYLLTTIFEVFRIIEYGPVRISLMFLTNLSSYLIAFRWCWLPGSVNVGQAGSLFSVVSL